MEEMSFHSESGWSGYTRHLSHHQQVSRAAACLGDRLAGWLVSQRDEAAALVTPEGCPSPPLSLSLVLLSLFLPLPFTPSGVREWPCCRGVTWVT